MPEQLKLVRELVAWAEELLALGYKTQMGNCRVQHRGGKKRRFTLNLITFLPKDHPGGNTQGCSCQIIWRLGRKIAPSCRPISAQ